MGHTESILSNMSVSETDPAGILQCECEYQDDPPEAINVKENFHLQQGEYKK